MSAEILTFPLGEKRHKTPSVTPCTVLRFPSNDRTRQVRDEVWAAWEKHCPPGRNLHDFRVDVLSTLRAVFPDKAAMFDTM